MCLKLQTCQAAAGVGVSWAGLGGRSGRTAACMLSGNPGGLLHPPSHCQSCQSHARCCCCHAGPRKPLGAALAPAPPLHPQPPAPLHLVSCPRTCACSELTTEPRLWVLCCGSRTLEGRRQHAAYPPWAVVGGVAWPGSASGPPTSPLMRGRRDAHQRRGGRSAWEAHSSQGRERRGREPAWKDSPAGGGAV